MAKLEAGKTGSNGQIEEPPIDRTLLDSYLESHCIPADYSRADDFDSFTKERRVALLNLIAAATGHPVSDVADTADDGVAWPEVVARDSGTTSEAE